MRKLILILLVCAAPLVTHCVAIAQSVVTVAPQQCIWRAGDNPAWAATSLDESGWQPYSAWKLDAHSPRIWVRCHTDLRLLRPLNQPALQVHLHAATQVFVNGALAGSSGDIVSGQFSLGDFYTVPLAPDSLTTTAVLALRITFRDLPTQTTPAEMFLGDRPALEGRRAAAALSGALGYLPVGLCFSLIGVVGFMLLGLWATDRSRPELLLLAVVCWLVCLLRLTEFCTYALVPMPFALYSILYSIGELLEVFWVPFIFRIAGKRIPWFYRVTIAVTLIFFFNIMGGAVLSPVLNLSQGVLYNKVVSFVMLAGMLCATAPFAAFWPWKRIPRNLRAIALFCMTWGAADVVWFSTWESNILGFTNPEQIFIAQKYILIVRAATTLCSVLALLTIFFREQQRIAKDRALMAGEMQAAREIQQYLIPDKLPPTPGLTIRSVYHPSREVGGDFFQVLPDARDGSTMIVVGDVAGKGLQAGMLAALIVGAIRTAFKFTSDPSSILSLLNERLQGRGLVTCLAMRIDRDGSMELANAGHLPPYINGRELAVEGAFPLGALPSYSFPIQRFQLGEGESLLFVSDGVVEARNEQGELFGFERTAGLSKQPAEEIAHAAQAFGQEDDITVLTLALAPVGAVHA
jgi:serine phosphatase RsbU (regulator of sigma subunit)